MKRMFNYVGLFLVSITFSVTLSILFGQNTPVFSQQPDAQQLEQITQSIQSCLPKPPEDAATAYQFELLTKQESGAQTFHLLLVKDPSDPNDYPWETLIVTEGERCENLIPMRSDVKTLTRFVPQPVANQLALARYQELLKTDVGKRLIRRQLTVITVPPGAPTDVDMDEYAIAPEDAWALKQLGIPVPSNFKVRPVETPIQQP